jgi:hypothetical protein
MYEKEEAFYAAHQAEFQKKYPDKWLIIVGEELFGAFDTIKDAFIAAQKRFGDQEFMLRRPSDDDTIDDYTAIENGETVDGTMTVVAGEPMVFTYA